MTELVDTLHENGYENATSVLEYADALHISGGLSPGQARAIALSQTSPDSTQETLSDYAGISRGAFAKSHVDATEALQEARTLARLTRDKYPIKLLANFAVYTAPEPNHKQAFDRILIGRYLPLGDAGDEPSLSYVVYCDSYELASDATFPTDNPDYLFTGTSVNRYKTESDMLADQYYDANFSTHTNDREMYRRLRKAGFDVQSNRYRELHEGMDVRFVGDPGNDSSLNRIQGESGEVTSLDGDDRVTATFPITNPDTGDDTTIQALAPDLEPVLE